VSSELKVFFFFFFSMHEEHEQNIHYYLQLQLQRLLIYEKKKYIFFLLEVFKTPIKSLFNPFVYQFFRFDPVTSVAKMETLNVSRALMKR
jgi:hypothetical protein